LIFSTIFAILACSKKINQSSLKPPKVKLVAAVADTSRIEQGIDAVPTLDAIRIEWYASEDERVKGYEIYRWRENIGINFVKLATTMESDTAFEDLIPNTNTTYYYYVLAVNDEDLKSESSDTVKYMLLQKATGLRPVGEIENTKPLFTWNDANQANEYIIRVQESTTGAIVWVSVVQADYGNMTQSIRYNADQKAWPSELQTGKEYQWRIDVRGQNLSSGSESKWVGIKIR